MSSITEQSPLERHLKLHHPELTEADLERTETAGYWRVKGGCPGGRDCRHGFRGELGPCAGGGDLIISFSQASRDAKGRFSRPHSYWESQAEQSPKPAGNGGEAA